MRRSICPMKGRVMTVAGNMSKREPNMLKQVFKNDTVQHLIYQYERLL